MPLGKKRILSGIVLFFLKLASLSVSGVPQLDLQQCAILQANIYIFSSVSMSLIVGNNMVPIYLEILILGVRMVLL